MWWTREAKITVYHGTDTEPELGQRSGYYPGTYTFENPDYSSIYGTKLFSTLIDSDKIYNCDDIKGETSLKGLARDHGFGYHSGNGNAEVAYLKSLGYIGMRRGDEIILFDKFKWEQAK